MTPSMPLLEFGDSEGPNELPPERNSDPPPRRRTQIPPSTRQRSRTRRAQRNRRGSTPDGPGKRPATSSHRVRPMRNGGTNKERTKAMLTSENDASASDSIAESNRKDPVGGAFEHRGQLFIRVTIATRRRPSMLHKRFPRSPQHSPSARLLPCRHHQKRRSTRLLPRSRQHTRQQRPAPQFRLSR